MITVLLDRIRLMFGLHGNGFASKNAVGKCCIYLQIVFRLLPAKLLSGNTTRKMTSHTVLSPLWAPIPCSQNKSTRAITVFIQISSGAILYKSNLLTHTPDGQIQYEQIRYLQLSLNQYWTLLISFIQVLWAEPLNHNIGSELITKKQAPHFPRLMLPFCSELTPWHEHTWHLKVTDLVLTLNFTCTLENWVILWELSLSPFLAAVRGAKWKWLNWLILKRAPALATHNASPSRTPYASTSLVTKAALCCAHTRSTLWGKTCISVKRKKRPVCVIII